jgi:hypothetical protein
MEQGAQQETSDEHVLQRNTAAEAIQVLVMPSDGAPRLQTVENRSDALEALVGGPFTTFPTDIEGTIGVMNVAAETGTPLCNTFIVAGDAGDGLSLQSLSPLQLEQVLERFYPTLPLAQFEQIVRSHPLGPEWFANWEGPEP